MYQQCYSRYAWTMLIVLFEFVIECIARITLIFPGLKISPGDGIFINASLHENVNFECMQVYVPDGHKCAFICDPCTFYIYIYIYIYMYICAAVYLWLRNLGAVSLLWEYMTYVFVHPCNVFQTLLWYHVRLKKIKYLMILRYVR